jgi:hypothetical protein
MHEMVTQLKTIHTGFFHKSARTIPARLSINATFDKCDVNGAERWMFLDIHEGGPANRLAHRPIVGPIVETLEKTVQGRKVGHALQTQRLARLAVLAQPHLGLAKGPVLLAHQTEDGQQLRLRERMFAEATPHRTARPTPRAMRANSKSSTSTIALVASEQTDPFHALAHSNSP